MTIIDFRDENGFGGTAGGVTTASRIGTAPADLGYDWLPAPLEKPIAVTRASKYPGMCRQSDTGLEKVLMGLLVLAAVVGIAYGFSCLVDLVQNWAAVNLGITKLI